MLLQGPWVKNGSLKIYIMQLMFWVIWNKMEGIRKNAVKGESSNAGGGGLGYLALQGKYGFFFMSLP